MDLIPFKNYLLVNGSSKSSAEMRVQRLGIFFNQYESLTQENLNAFLSSKLEKWGGTSFNIFLNAIRHYLKFAKIDGLEIPKTHKINHAVKPYINEKDFCEIVEKLPIIFQDAKKIEVIISLLFYTGLRPKELLQLKRENFDFEKKIIEIKDTKTHYDRVVALPDSLSKIIPIIFNCEPENENAFNLTYPKLNYIFLAISNQLNLKNKLSPYSMRHCFAHDMMKKGVNINSLQSTMGHKNITTTLGYSRVNAEEATEEIRKLINKKRRK